MDIVGSLASLIAVTGLIKEIGGVTKEVIQGYRDAPLELQLFSNHLIFIQLELDCLTHLRDDLQRGGFQLPESDVRILESLLRSALENIKSIRDECTPHLAKGKGFASRLGWAFSNRKSCERLVRHVQTTEGALCTIINIINVGLAAATRTETAIREGFIIQRLDVVQQEIKGQTAGQLCDSSKPSHLSAQPEAYQLISAFKLPDKWRIALRGNLETRTARNAFQNWHDFYLRLPVPTLNGNKGFVMAITYRTWPSCWTGFTILGGELGFKNVVSSDSEVIQACAKGDTLKVRDMFLSGRARPTDVTTEDRNLLYYATMSGSEELVRFLLNSGTPVRSSLLLASSFWRRPQIARNFISRGASVDVFGAFGFTAAFYLFGSTRPKVQQVELIEILASNSFANFNAQDEKGWTATHRAAAFGTGEDVRTLNRMGAALGVRTNNLWWTPVFTAVCYNNLETLLEIMTIQPPDKGEADLRGWTLLHIAIGAGSFDVIPELLRLGCDPKAVSNATSHTVPEMFVDRAVTPDDIARACGEETYGKWSQLLTNAGIAIAEDGEAIEWDSESPNLEFGGCECCDKWCE